MIQKSSIESCNWPKDNVNYIVMKKFKSVEDITWMEFIPFSHFFSFPLSIQSNILQRLRNYIEEMLRFKNEVWQAKQKWDKREGDTKTNSDKSDKRHKPDKG